MLGDAVAAGAAVSLLCGTQCTAAEDLAASCMRLLGPELGGAVRVFTFALAPPADADADAGGLTRGVVGHLGQVQARSGAVKASLSCVRSRVLDVPCCAAASASRYTCVYVTVCCGAIGLCVWLPCAEASTPMLSQMLSAAAGDLKQRAAMQLVCSWKVG